MTGRVYDSHMMTGVSKGDIFGTPGGDVVRVTRVGRSGWVDVIVVQAHGASWTKRMPKGIPDGWSRYPR